MTDRQRLLRQIQMADFALFETALFLDSHKNDREALSYFQRKRELSKKLREEYAEKYGPLKKGDVTSQTEWTWSDGPWPWEFSSDSNG